MPTPKQMEKLADKRPAVGAPAAAPDAPLPAEYWESVLKDPRAGATCAAAPPRRLLRNSPTCAARLMPPLRPDRGNPNRDAVLYGGNAVWKDVAQRLLRQYLPERPDATKKTDAGRLRVAPATPVCMRYDIGCPDGAEIPPHAFLRRRSQGSEKGTRQGSGDDQHLAAQSSRSAPRGGPDQAGRQAPLRKSGTSGCGPTANRSIRRPSIEQAVNGGYSWSRSNARVASRPATSTRCEHPPRPPSCMTSRAACAAANALWRASVHPQL